MSLNCPHHFRFCALTITAFFIRATIFSLVYNSFLIFGLNILLFNFLVFSFRLDDESQHLALRRLNHSFVFFARCPCSCCVTKSRRNCGIEKAQSMIEQVFFDVSSCLYLWKVAQAALILLLIYSVSCWWNEILWPEYFRFRFFVNISMLISPTLIYLFVFEFMLLWLLRIFVLSGWILSPTFSVAFLNSYWIQ